MSCKGRIRCVRVTKRYIVVVLVSAERSCGAERKEKKNTEVNKRCLVVVVVVR